MPTSQGIVTHSVTHLRSYTNSRNYKTGIDVAVQSAGIAASSADIVALIERRVFHDVLRISQCLVSHASFDISASHYGGNTHFRRICSSVPNFNFKYEYMKFAKSRDKNLKNYVPYFWKNNTKTGKQRKLRKWRDQIHIFFIILQVTTSIVIVYKPQ